jgi:hypothetical protein
MKWVLVVLIGGAAPVQTDLVFEKLTDCLAAEEQLQQAYADAYTSWNRRFIVDDDRSERRRYRDYRRAKDSETRKFANTGTCIPHAGSDQPIISPNKTPEPSSTNPPPAPPKS